MESFDQFLSFAPEVLLKLTVALLCGGAIGMERERRGKPAGLRTNILICIGSMLYTLMSIHIAGYPGAVHETGLPDSVVRLDVARIAAQIVVGIGFIGAGAIMRERGAVVGLTSAAMIWVVGAIGILIGAGYTLLALGVSVFCVLALILMADLERRVLGRCQWGMLHARFRDDDITRREAINILVEHEIAPNDYTLTRGEGEMLLEMRYCTRHPSHHRFLHAFQELPGFLTYQTTELPG